MFNSLLSLSMSFGCSSIAFVLRDAAASLEVSILDICDIIDVAPESDAQVHKCRLRCKLTPLPAFGKPGICRNLPAINESAQRQSTVGTDRSTLPILSGFLQTLY